MLNFIMVPLICGILVLGFYKLFELFACKKERLLIIERMDYTLYYLWCLRITFRWS